MRNIVVRPGRDRDGGRRQNFLIVGGRAQVDIDLQPSRTVEHNRIGVGNGARAVRIGILQCCCARNIVIKVPQSEELTVAVEELITFRIAKTSCSLFPHPFLMTICRIGGIWLIQSSSWMRRHRRRLSNDMCRRPWKSLRSNCRSGSSRNPLYRLKFRPPATAGESRRLTGRTELNRQWCCWESWCRAPHLQRLAGLI